MSRIVVGVDGSPGAVLALDWAVAEARVRGRSGGGRARLRAPAGPYTYAIVASPAGSEDDARRRVAEEELDRVLAKSAKELAEVDVHRSVICGAGLS